MSYNGYTKQDWKAYDQTLPEMDQPMSVLTYLRMNHMESGIDEVANEAVRIRQLLEVGNVSDALLQEIINSRIDYSGTSHNSIGDAIRTQYKLLNDSKGDTLNYALDTNKLELKSGNRIISSLEISPSSIGALPNTTIIPTKMSQLENDSNYLSAAILNGYATQEYVTQSQAGLLTSTAAAETYVNKQSLPTELETFSTSLENKFMKLVGGSITGDLEIAGADPHLNLKCTRSNKVIGLHYWLSDDDGRTYLSIYNATTKKNILAFDELGNIAISGNYADKDGTVGYRKYVYPANGEIGNTTIGLSAYATMLIEKYSNGRCDIHMDFKINSNTCTDATQYIAFDKNKIMTLLGVTSLSLSTPNKTSVFCTYGVNSLTDVLVGYGMKFREDFVGLGRTHNTSGAQGSWDLTKAVYKIGQCYHVDIYDASYTE